VNPLYAHIRRRPHLWAAPTWLFVGLMAGCSGPPAPPVLTLLPSYDLIDSRGEPFGSKQLAGQVYVANLFFTRCTNVCPMLMTSISTLRDRYSERGIAGIRLVSISVDGAHDTPDQLATYAKRFEIEPETWSLLTGPPEQVRPLVLEGFRLPLGDRQEDEQGMMQIAHAGRLVLVDRWGQVRGYYASDASGLDEIFVRSLHLLNEQQRPAPPGSLAPQS